MSPTRPAAAARPRSADAVTEAATTGRSVKMLAAIAHEGRLTLLRRLVQAGSRGLPAGDLARSASVSATTASAQLLVLANAGLVYSRREGRQVIYSANYAELEELLGFLIQDCCCDHPQVCSPLMQRLQAPPADGGGAC